VLFKNCVNDVTNNNKYWGGYRLGATYRVTRPLLFDGGDLADSVMWPLHDSVRHRVSFDEYVKEPSRFPGVTLIPEGTGIYFGHLRIIRSFEFSALQISGRFVDGPASGKWSNLLWVSTTLPDSQGKAKKYVRFRGNSFPLFWPNPKFLNDHE
jgi:hypothetical protein